MPLEYLDHVLAVQAGKLDLAYIREWADQLGMRELFERLLTAVQSIL